MLMGLVFVLLAAAGAYCRWRWYIRLLLYCAWLTTAGRLGGTKSLPWAVDVVIYALVLFVLAYYYDRFRTRKVQQLPPQDRTVALSSE